MDRRKSHLVLQFAFERALADRRQFVNDNDDCAPDQAALFRTTIAAFEALRQQLFTEESESALRRAQALEGDDHQRLMDVLYFAIIDRDGLIDSLADVDGNAGVVREARKDRQAFRRLLRRLSANDESPPASAAKAVPILECANLIPDDAWQDSGDGGKVFIPRLP